jgi:hypothetical protein
MPHDSPVSRQSQTPNLPIPLSHPANDPLDIGTSASTFGGRVKIVPAPRETILPDDSIEVATYYQPSKATAVAPPFNQLPQAIQELHLWAQSQRSWPPPKRHRG